MAFVSCTAAAWGASSLPRSWSRSTSRRRPPSFKSRRPVSATTAGASSPPPAFDGGADEAVSQPPAGEAEEDTASSQTTGPDPFENAQQTVQTAVNSLFDAFFTPIRAACPLLSSTWTPAFDNYILYPVTDRPKSVIHFLGGAFFGAIPHLAYNSLLRRLAARGHVIVATPYNLSFDYLPVADGVARAWEAIEADLAFRYGPLPVVGVGHSAGAVFHALTAALFDDAAPKAANILISFNCRSAADAIPNYAQLVAPIARAAVATERSLPEELRTGLQDLPNRIDRMIDDNMFTPTALRNELLPTARQGRRFIDQISPLLREIAEPVEASNVAADTGVSVDGGTAVRSGSDSVGVGVDGSMPAGATQGTTRRQTPRPRIGGEARGEREFYPPPNEVCAAVEQLYPVAETLVIRFENDSLDDSPQLVEVLQRCDGANHSVVQLPGSHLTPLAPDAPDFAAASSAISGGVTQGLFGAVGGVIAEIVGALGARDLTNLEVVIDEWIDAGIRNKLF